MAIKTSYVGSAGPGHSINRRCAKCGQARPAKGGGLRMLYGFRQFVCVTCKKAIDKIRGVSP